MTTIERLAERREELLTRVADIDRQSSAMQRDIESLRLEIADLDALAEDLEAERTTVTLELIQIDNDSREMLTAWNASAR